MLDNIIASNGFGITLTGIFFIFLGLIGIALVIGIFNYFLNKQEQSSKPETDNLEEREIGVTPIEKIPDEEVAAIAAAIETYRRIHYTKMLQEITFQHGDSRSPWKTSGKFTNKTY